MKKRCDKIKDLISEIRTNLKQRGYCVNLLRKILKNSAGCYEFTDSDKELFFRVAYNAGISALNHFKNYFDAIKNFELAYDYIKFTSDYKKVRFFKSFSLAYNNAKQYTTAERYINMAINIYKNNTSLDKEYYYKILLIKAFINFNLGKRREAEQLYLKYYTYLLKKKNSGLSIDYELIGLVHQYLFDNYDKDKAENIIKKFSKDNINSFLYTAILYRYEKNFKKADLYFKKFINHPQFQYNKTRFSFNFEYGFHLLENKKYEEAEKHFLAAIEYLDKQRMALRDIEEYTMFLNHNIKKYLKIFYNLYQVNPKTAYSIIVLIKNMYYYYETELEDFESPMTMDKINYSFKYFDIVKFDLNEYQKKLGNNDIIFDYYYDSKSIYIFKITKNSFESKKIKIDINIIKEIINIVNLTQKHINKLFSVRSINDDILEIMYKKISAILINKEIKNRNIYFVPFGRLNYFNFYNIIYKNDFLLRKNNIYILQNIMLFHKINKNRDLKIGIIANKKIPYIKEEIKNIKKYFTASLFKNLKDLQKISEYDILHFATHFYRDIINFENSYFELNNKKLLLKDLKDLKYRNKKLILNVCESGRKKKLLSEEYLDSARIFLVNKASEVIVSMYEIPTKMSSDFFAKFYKYLKSDKNFSLALRKTLLANPEFIKVNPYFIRI